MVAKNRQQPEPWRAVDETPAMAPTAADAVHTRAPCENWLWVAGASDGPGAAFAMPLSPVAASGWGAVVSSANAALLRPIGRDTLR